MRLSLVCAPAPLERGLHLDRAGISPDAVTVDGASTDAWVSRHKSVPADEWARSFCLTVTDPRFTGGKLRALDVDVTYMHAANTKVEVVAATQTGSRVIGSGWGTSPGQTPQWQTLHCHLEDADFGNRSYHNDPKTLPWTALICASMPGRATFIWRKWLFMPMTPPTRTIGRRT